MVVEWFVLLMYWTIDGRKHHEMSPAWPTAAMCSTDGEAAVKTVKGQGALGAHFRCFNSDAKPEGLPDFFEQPKAPPGRST